MLRADKDGRMLFLHNEFFSNIFKYKWNRETGHLLTKIFNLANILNCRANFFTNLEAVESRSRSLELQSIDGLFESRKFEKVKGSNIVKCVQNKYFSYIIDKIVSLRRNFSKALVILSWFLLLFFLSFSLIVYISLEFHLEVFQSEHFCISIV